MRIYILAILAYLLYTSCANIVPPTGGPKDHEPPQVTYSYPENGTVNYRENYIIVHFDEDIEDNQLSTKVIVSPIIKGIYKVKINKSILKLSWQDTLKENTTYTFNIAEGVKDFTESNAIESYSITFSTGPSIDSNNVTANINPLPGETINPHTKLLIFPVSDSILGYIRKKPEYVSAVDKTGKLHIPYIKEGYYTLISVIDYNKDNEWTKTEPIDIEKNVFIKGTLTKQYQVQNTTIDTAKLVSTNNSEKVFKLFFGKGLQKISIKDSSGEYIAVKKTPREYVIHNQYNLKDTTKIQIDFVDSSGINHRITKKIKFKGTDHHKDKDTIINIEQVNKNNKLRPGLDSIQFNLSKYSKDSIQLQITAPKYVTYSLTHNYTDFKIILKGQREHDSIFIAIPKNTMLSIYGEKNSAFNRKYVTEEEREYGNLYFTVKTEYKNYTVYLEDSKNNIVYKATDKINNHVKNLEPGEYRLYAIVDSNRNGTWEGYDPLSDSKAEPKYYFPQKILIKANWDVEDIQMIF